MKRPILIAVSAWIISPFCVAAENSTADSERPRIVLAVPYVSRIGEPFSIDISIVPPVKTPVVVTLQPVNGIAFANSKIVILPGQKRSVSAKAASSGADGIPWIRATAEGFDFSEIAVDLGFLGHLKPNTTGKLPYGVPSTLTLSLVDKDGKPFVSDKELDVSVDSADAHLQMGTQQNGTLKFRLLRNANVSPQFQIVPRNLVGGDVHLNTTLTFDGISEDFSLDSQSLTLSTEPVWWLPIVLAVGGGLLYGIYKALDFKTWPPGKVLLSVVTIILSSGLAGVLGYLIANLDLLGLKLDPGVLRSYPLSGFLVAYLGIDALASKKLVPS
ncbi:MAG: hypothetical protein WA803_18355 [Steroidobacteraceae bacterium]